MPEESHASSAFLAGIREGIEVVSVAVEVLAIGIIVVGIVLGTAHYWRRSLARPPDQDAYGVYKRRLARSLLLGLEILVAADIVRTVALDATLPAIAALGLLVLVRTFLSWALVVEMEGRWPWQQRGPLNRSGPRPAPPRGRERTPPPAAPAHSLGGFGGSLQAPAVARLKPDGEMRPGRSGRPRSAGRRWPSGRG